ncbi:hypothetical protein CP533_0169 [Ophiocordyceps camponoti-saundersi (nom. inval.)]|nr:hypothetical protein CP533_0169 [Ophiocordyceps camponoti-saundersi (nom. inval.)]
MADKPVHGHPHSSSAFDKSPSSVATWQTVANQPNNVSFSASPYSAPNLRPLDSFKTSMAPPPLPTKASLGPRKVEINSLMSPPDAFLDSFAPFAAKNMPANITPPSAQQPLRGTPPQQQPLMSPPVSPYSKPTVANTSPAAPRPQTSPPPSAHQVKDPVLYPAEDASPTNLSQPPLFAPAESDHQRIIDQHIGARLQTIFADVSPPRREDYELALTFRSQVMKLYNADRRSWLRQERAFLEADRRARARGHHVIMPAKPVAVIKPSRPQRDRAVRAHPVNPRQMRNHSQQHQQGQGQRQHPHQLHVAAAAPPATTVPAKTPAAVRVSATPEPSRRIVAPNREDKDFDALPNFCPPTSSLPNRPNSLKVDWKGQPIDLSNDRNAHLLHPDELMLAGNLRLDCATYLTSKRRIFERRLQCLRTGKEFRKTDAQQACKIDVNKASKLWTAFEKVGWLDAEWVRKYL